MFRFVLFSLLLLVFQNENFSFELPGKYSTYFTWSANRKLTWNDFKENYKVSKYSVEAAKVSTSITYGCSVSNNEISYIVEARLYPKASWSNKEAQFDYVLQHEQLHFDITELFARKLRKILSEKIKNHKDYKLVNKYGDKISDDWDVFQDKYDRETDHGTNDSKQKEWNIAIQQQLKMLEDFASK
ncbi:MAG: hypothetical protein KDD21_00875 [Bacteroidetes bacterium]|nr:hypothetical protein [Bacteroidota bacterium]